MNWLYFVRPFVLRNDDGVYQLRCGVHLPSGHGVRLHYMRRGDKDPDDHDHPWDFTSILLFGQYWEEVCYHSTDKRWSSGLFFNYHCIWFNQKRAEDSHRITRVSRFGVLTLVFTGRKRRSWGFWRPGYGWTPWRQYLELRCVAS